MRSEIHSSQPGNKMVIKHRTGFVRPLSHQIRQLRKGYIFIQLRQGSKV